MNLSMLLEMAADGLGDRIAVGRRSGGITYAELLDRARRVGAWLQASGGDHAGLVDRNSEAVPLLLFGSSFANKPFVPLNFRLADDQLRTIVERISPAPVVVDDPAVARLDGIGGIQPVTRGDFLGQLASTEPAEPGWTDPDDIAVLLFTSGTSGEPKAAVLRHKHLASYVIGTVEFMASGEDEAALVSVPAYHIAGISAILSSVYGGRRIVYLPQFDPEEWVALAREEAITHAMVVPTMLGRILEILERDGEKLPALRHVSYGGGRMPVPVIERALELIPHVNFVNAYGLTETSSTVSVLGPDDHRVAIASDDPAIRGRLASVGQPLPTIEVEIRDPEGQPVAAGERGEIYVRGEQVAGEYLGRSTLTDDGWFPTNDAGRLDPDGFLYLEGRLDDVIVRGGENMSPGEIEDVLVGHPAVREACVVGIPDTEWGEAVAAAVVLHEGVPCETSDLQAWVRDRLRSSKVPERIEIRPELPYTDTGKLLRRVIKSELS